MIFVLFTILFIQAISDACTKKVYYYLNIIGIIIGMALMVNLQLFDDGPYILISIIFIILHQKLGAYASGDSKLFFIVLSIISMSKRNIDILNYFLIIELGAIIIFILYVILIKIITKEKEKNYPYAPAIFTSTLIYLLL